MLQKGFLVYLEIAFDQCETNLVYFWYTTKSYNDNLMLEKWFKIKWLDHNTKHCVQTNSKIVHYFPISTLNITRTCF
jgi:hypothetical protein